jgi:hypothetical protein
LLVVYEGFANGLTVTSQNCSLRIAFLSGVDTAWNVVELIDGRYSNLPLLKWENGQFDTPLADVQGTLPLQDKWMSLVIMPCYAHSIIACDFRACMGQWQLRCTYHCKWHYVSTPKR